MIERFEDEYGIRYRLDGRFHRANGPARTWDDGDYMWCLNGKSHRYYGPCSNYGGWSIHGRTI